MAFFFNQNPETETYFLIVEFQNFKIDIVVELVIVENFLSNDSAFR